jgi:hypothetical protein
MARLSLSASDSGTVVGFQGRTHPLGSRRGGRRVLPGPGTGWKPGRRGRRGGPPKQTGPSHGSHGGRWSPSP